jgi:hypothetical protein
MKLVGPVTVARGEMTLCLGTLSSIVPLIKTCRVRVCYHHMRTTSPNHILYVILLIDIDTHELTR